MTALRIPKFDPWAAIGDTPSTSANDANPANPAMDLANVSNFSNISRPLLENSHSDQSNVVEIFGDYEERAAIREYDGGLPRPEAERLAFDDCAPDLAARERLSDALKACDANGPKNDADAL